MSGAEEQKLRQLAAGLPALVDEAGELLVTLTSRTGDAWSVRATSTPQALTFTIPLHAIADGAISVALEACNNYNALPHAGRLFLTDPTGPEGAVIHFGDVVPRLPDRERLCRAVSAAADRLMGDVEEVWAALTALAKPRRRREIHGEQGCWGAD